MDKGVYNGLAESLQRYFIYVLAFDPMYFTADVQVFHQKGHCLLKLRQEVVADIAPVIYVYFIRALECDKGHLSLEKVGLDVFSKEENASVLYMSVVGNLKTAQEVRHESSADADASLSGETFHFGSGYVVEGEAFDCPLFEWDRLVLRKHYAQFVVAHLLSGAVETPVVAGSAGIRLLIAFRNDDSDYFSYLHYPDGYWRFAVSRQAVYLCLEVIGQPFPDH